MELVGLAFLIFLAPCIYLCAAQDPPFIDTSYGASGEIILQSSPDDVVAVAFEENFDYESRQSVFTAKSLGFATTLVEDMRLNQTFKYDQELVDDQFVTTCKVYSPLEWRRVHTPPDLELFEFKQEAVFFPMMQLLWGLSPRFIKPGTKVESKSYRDIPCDVWTYQLNYTNSDKTVDYIVNIEAYWSNGLWNTSTQEKVVPIGFKIHHNGVNKTSGEPVKMDQFVNVMYFTKGYFNREAFLPKQGIFCPGRKNLKPFPQFGDFTALSLSVEFEWKYYKLVSNVDMHIDSTSKMVQVAYDPMNQYYNPLTPGRKISSVLIANHDQTIAYDRRGDTCQVIPLQEVEDDVQTLYDMRLLSELTSSRFFGQGVNYVYIGETIKRGIPCHLWQGQRRGWPSSEPSITTVWEWCIAERVGNPLIFENGALPIVSLDITVTESHLTIAAGAYTLGTQFSYNFYDVIQRKPSYLRTSEFDISPCFPEQYKEWLQFKVDVKSTKNVLKNATVYADFVDLWRTAIYGAIGIEPSTMRVAKVRTLLEDNVLFVQFYLLDRHPDTPTNIKKDVDLKEMKKRLKSTIDGDALSIDWLNLVLKASKGSLETVFELKFPTPVTPTSTEATQPTKSSTTSSVSTVPTKPSSKTKATPRETKSTDNTNPVTKSSTARKPETVTDSPKRRSAEKRHSPGTMAGLGIGMLLLGFSLGAGGTFAKFRYF